MQCFQNSGARDPYFIGEVQDLMLKERHFEVCVGLGQGKARTTKEKRTKTGL